MIVTGFAFWGGVGVERKVTRAERQRLKEERRQEKLERKESCGSSGSRTATTPSRLTAGCSTAIMT
ncbi:hypothetical protein SALBM311S_13077 [Streptomyces alboniger]